MDEMSKTVEPDEVEFGGLFTIQEDGMMVITDRPDWVKNPKTGKKYYVRSMWAAEQNIPCPRCKVEGKHGIIVAADPPEADIIIICCQECKRFVWTKLAQ